MIQLLIAPTSLFISRLSLFFTTCFTRSYQSNIHETLSNRVFILSYRRQSYLFNQTLDLGNSSNVFNSNVFVRSKFMRGEKEVFNGEREMRLIGAVRVSRSINIADIIVVAGTSVMRAVSESNIC